MFPGVFVFLVQVASACAPAGRPILAEILYDPSGADSGFEFVEIFNPGDAAASLAGTRLEAGDGAAPGGWSLRWTGAPGDSVAAHGRFLIGGARVEPAPQAVVTLDLQNGPDAIRLAWPDGATEVVGYGAHEFPEYFCGEPAADAPSGQSLARLPDDSSLGANALDFRPSPPTPGHANQSRRDAALAPGSLALLPPQPEAETKALLALCLTNRGRDPIAAGELRVRAATHGEFGERVLFDTPAGPELAAGDTMTLEVATAPLPEGRQTIVCRVALDGDESPGNDADTLRTRAGPGPLEITEIQFHPAAGEGEWVEVRNRSREVLSMDRFTLSDRGTGRGVPRGSGRALLPESLAVLAQDRAALLARFPAIDSSSVWQTSPWSSLNNTNDASGAADAVVLREADGVPCARVDYSAAGVPSGVPLALEPGGLWGAASEPLGSPLRPPRPLGEIAGRFEIAPRRLSAATAATRLSWALPWPRARVAADLFALSGARVVSVLPELAAPARGEREWRPAGVPPGLYLLVFQARPEGGGEGLSVTRAIRIEGVR